MDDTELLNLFWTEVREYLDMMNKNVMALEMSMPEEDAGAFVERLRELNRVAHSMKGAARAVGVANVELIGYHMEEMFDAALKRGLGITPEIADLLYDALDLVQREADGETVEANLLATVIEQLNHAVEKNATFTEDELEEVTNPVNPRESDTYKAIHPENGAADAAAPFTENETAELEDADVPLPPAPQKLQQKPQKEEKPFITSRNQSMTQTMLVRPPEDTVRVSVDKLDRLMQDASELLVARLQSEERKQNLDQMRRLHSKWAKEWRAVRASYIRLARRLQMEEASEELRDLLEFLETNQRYLTDTSREVISLASAFTNDTMRLSALTDEIQEGISSLRLVPFDTILGTLHRTLRDASRETGKEAHLDVVGSSTEIDKSVLEHLKDPIMHLIRNSVDHGIEPPAEREAAGKPRAGWVYLNIETRGSEIIVMVGDDGRGIDPNKVRLSAIEAGLVSASTAHSMPDTEVHKLIFHPGLTTRSEVTAISGRGVGMDVVRERVESLRGHVSLSSRLGEGTVTTISVPVSLTRIRCVIVGVGGEQYAIPSLAVVRMERVEPDDIFTAEGRSVIKIGERTIPIVSLADMLSAPIPKKLQENNSIMRVIVLNASDRQVAFEVDEMTSEREMVLKPLGTELTNTRYVSGAALLGGGEVVIVLDVNDLVRGATGASIPKRRTSTNAAVSTSEESRPLRVLIADDSITTRTLEKNILETAGCDVRVAFDGVQAWEILMEHPFDVIISDVEMPRMDGLTLTRRIKENPTTRQIPVILLTSLNNSEHREAGLNAGADAYLVKARFDQDELLRTIRSVL